MTFTVKLNDGDRKRVDVGITYGPIMIRVEEDMVHLRSFHFQLGKLLDESEKEG